MRPPRRFLAEVRSGHGQVLIVRGEAGIGKSALVDYLVERADDCRVARASGVESELELPYAGLHQLCTRMLDVSDQLPTPQRDALAVALGYEVGGPPDRFLVGAATLSLLSAVSDRQPLLCVIDDAQWLDQAAAQTLTLVGRRLLADHIGVVFAIREPVDGPEWRGFPELEVGGLANGDAKALLDAVVPGRLDGHVRDRIVTETGGNPLALLELPRGLTAAGLFELGVGVRFRHPLVRSATYRMATHSHRREIHNALAEATDPDLDPDRRAWHRASGADGPDEDIASELARSADRAQGRGGIAATAAFLRRAAELTPDSATRASRALTAAQATLQAGAFETALKLLITAEEGDDLHEAKVNLLRARIAFAAGHNVEAPSQLLDAARRLEPFDLELARDTYLEAVAAAQFAERLTKGTALGDAARAARAAPKPTVRDKPDLLLDGVAALFTDGYPAAVQPAREAIRAYTGADRKQDQDDFRWLWLAALLAVDVWDDVSWDLLTARYLRIARELGDLIELLLVLHHRIVFCLFAGEIPTAISLDAKIQTINEATGAGLAPHGGVVLAAWRGHEDEAVALIANAIDESEARGEGGGMTTAHFANAVLFNGLARYQDALASAQAATVYPSELGIANWSLPELVEAATRVGRPDLAAEAFERLTTMALACDTDWALGVLARSQALLSTGLAAESCYQEAIERLGRTRVRMELARAHLLYGEWLRREGRRQDARGQLRTAYDLFATAGADAFAERTRRELAASGEAVDERDRRATDALTAQETYIAELAGAGLTNAEIGAQLFLSHHTVEWHLRKVFAKLGISSRRQLRASTTG